MKVIFLAWAKYHSRTDYLGKSLNAKVYFIWQLNGTKRLFYPVKYLLQTWETIAILLRERPSVILVQTPPVFPALIACIYAYWRNVSVIIDTHSGSFFSRKWRWALPLHRWCSRHARVTLVHLQALLPLVREWGVPALVAGYIGEAHPLPDPCPLPAGFNVAVPCSFNLDEPIDHILDAARRLPMVHFHITGDRTRISARRLALKPSNVTFTGYLPSPAYFGLLQNADAVMVLTTQADTLQCGGVEAVSLGRPLITSNWPALRQVFLRGAIFVDNLPASIVTGVCQAQARSNELAAEAQDLKLDLDKDWETNLAVLRNVVQGDVVPTMARSKPMPLTGGEIA
jgi:glycosyltransferase involved in cell wall biosynthesis